MPLKILVAYSMASTHVQTTIDYLKAVQRFSGADVSYLHVTNNARVEVDFAEFDVVFHNYCARLVFEGYVSASYRLALRRFQGLKVLAVQDEYDATNRLKSAIKDCGFHIVLTCVPQDCLEYVYPRDELPDVEFITVFTGYVPDDFAASAPRLIPLAERPLTVGYRGRDIGPMYGRLGREKYDVGARMQEVCDRLGVRADIAMDEKSRIYGPAWLQFIGSCRSMLGSESGSNVFDFDGSIRRRFNDMTNTSGRPPTHEEFASVIAERDGAIDIGQISPRVFECAVMRTPMILLRGRYSGAIEPDVHYIALEKDYSNAEAVVARLQDLGALEAMVERTYQHLVASGQFGYRRFWQTLMPRLQARLATLPRVAPLEAPAKDKVVDPRQGPTHPLVQVPTAALKTIEDFKRQRAQINRYELGAFGVLFSGLVSYLPHDIKMKLGRGLKSALEAKEQGQSLTMKAKVYLTAWQLLPGFFRTRLEGQLKHIDYAGHERKRVRKTG